MSGEYIEPSDVVEHEGDVISGADFNSIEHTIDTALLEDIDPYSVKAAQSLVDITQPSVKTPEAPVAPKEADTRSAAERAYDVAYDKVERRMDQGLDKKAAWAEADPTGAIQKAFEKEENDRQVEVNRSNADIIRSEIHEAKVAAINAMPNADARKRALTELFAQEQAANEKRYRRY